MHVSIAKLTFVMGSSCVTYMNKWYCCIYMSLGSKFMEIINFCNSRMTKSKIRIVQRLPSNIL